MCRLATCTSREAVACAGCTRFRLAGYNGCMRIAGLAFIAACLQTVVAVAQVVLPPNLGVPGGGDTVPSPGHDLALQQLAAADYQAAAEIASREYQGSVKIGGQRWIDSIASAAVFGECLYELGGLVEAIARYEESMLVMATHADWILALQFPQQPLRQTGRGRGAAWGRSERATSLAAVPEVVPIRQGGGDPQAVLQRGGVLAAPFDRPVRPQEIIRCLVIAIYRHGSLLGELNRDNPSVAAVAKTLSRRPALPDHYSQAWIDIALGTAQWSQGRQDLAGPLLTRGLIIGNGLDHPLTPWGLLVLGRIALDADDPRRAAKLFEEATYSAADFGDARALEEAFHWAFAAHQLAGMRGVPPSIRGGSDWSRGTLPALHWQLLGFEAEALAASGDVRAATAALADIDGRVLRGPAGQGRIGGQAAFAAATIGYASGDVAAGDADLERAVVIARARTPRLFQTARLLEAVLGGSAGLSDRQADELFAKLLADPVARDFGIDPLGTLATISASRADAFEAWLAAASRRGEPQAIEVAEAMMRNRWLESQPLGGRRIAASRLLAADPRALAPDAAARRAAILGGRRDVAAVVDRLAQLRVDLAAGLAAAGPEAAPAKAEWGAYRGQAAKLWQAVAALAAGREGIPQDFPPLTPAAEIRRRLEPRQLMLSFHWTRGGLVGLLESRDRFAIWQVRQAADLPAAVKSFAKGLCLFDASGAVSSERLAAGDWRASAERIERILFENSKVTLGEGIDELVIVPDGWLWYVPFELLPVASNRGDAQGGEASRPLRDVCRIRYAPTRSLAVATFETTAPGLIGVAAGRMLRGEKPTVAEETQARLSGAIDRVVPLATAQPVLAASTVDTLVVFEELTAAGPTAAREILAPGPGRAGATFGDWLAPPPKRPRRIVLPGLQTAMADGFDAVPARPGDDAFSAAMDLLAAGGTTAVMSRWRTGGKACVDLVTEFLREATQAEQPSAAVAWQRAVDVVLAEPLDPEREPRLKLSADAPLPDSLPPFFWAGYILVDCGTGRHADAPAPAAVLAPGQPAAPQVKP
jgi:hypothetical protein